MLNTIHDRLYLYSVATKCRACGIGDESIEHIVNWYMVSDEINTVPASIYTDNVVEGDAEDLTNMVRKFYEAIEELAEIS